MHMDTSTSPPPVIEPNKKPHPWPHIILALGFATILGLLVASYISINIGENSIYPTNANNLRMDNLEVLREHIVDAETGVRGFMLTRDSSFLGPYKNSSAKVNEVLKQIKQSYTQHSTREQNLANQLEKLTQQRFLNLGLIVNAINNNDAEGARKLMYSGQPVMDEIRNVRQALRKQIVIHQQTAMDQALSRLNLMQGMIYILGISTITLLIIWFAATQRQQRLRNEFDQILLERNYALEMKVQSRTEELVSLAGYLSNARETEKANLARELHDELGALLTAAKHDAGWVERKLLPETQPAIRERVARLQQTLNSVIALKRDLINNLRPAMLHDLGLLTALRNLTEELANSTDINVKTELPQTEMSLPEPVALALFRIVQEAFTNSRKYSGATEVLLELFEDGDKLILNLYDNGIGFDLNSPTIARHGLAGMKHRVQMLKGTIELVTAPGKGVLITVEIPTQAGRHQNRIVADRRQSSLSRANWAHLETHSS
jgi:signal transduction histidine kinase